MGFSRFFNLFLFGLIIISCHEEKRNANINIQLDDFADWNIREYSLSSRKIRHEIDSIPVNTMPPVLLSFGLPARA